MGVLAGNMISDLHVPIPKLRESRTRRRTPFPPGHQPKAWMKESTMAVKHPTSPQKRVWLGDSCVVLRGSPWDTPGVGGDPGGEVGGREGKGLVHQ